jgi:CHAD domain-containing protein
MTCDDPFVVPELNPESSAADVVRAALHGALRSFLEAEAIARAGCTPTAVHRARVALRRLRSDLRTFAPVLDEAWQHTLRNRIARLTPAFAAARDADVLLARVADDLACTPDLERERAATVLRLVQGVRDAAYRQLGARLREPRYARARADVLAAAGTPAFTADGERPARDVVSIVMDDVWKRLRRAVRGRERPTDDEELHRIRIKAKRVRYAAEALTPICGTSAARFAKRAAALQSVLGDHRDAVAACTHLQRELAGGDGAFVASELAAIERDCARLARRRWKRVWQTLDETPPFWR